LFALTHGRRGCTGGKPVASHGGGFHFVKTGVKKAVRIGSIYRAGIIAVLIGLSTASHAQMLCDRPNKPSCIDMLSISRDDLTFQTCRDEVDTYRRQMIEYMDCLHRESDDAADELKKQIEHFNECARSEICF
jgi:hypothetical protein